MYSSNMLTQCNIESAVEDVKAQTIEGDIVKLPLADRVWPNCIGWAIHNSGLVDVNQFSAKLSRISG